MRFTERRNLIADQIVIPRLLPCLLIWTSFAAFAAAGSDDARFLDGLRQRQLFELAESYCRRQAVDERLDAAGQTAAAIELIRTYAAHAVNSPPAQREPLWQAARDTAADFERQHPGHPRSILIAVQDALTELARGELARQEAEVLVNPDESLLAAKAAIREAAKRLDEIDQRLTREIPLRYRSELEQDDLTAEELVALQYNVRYHQARAYRNRALCYPEDSDDRLAALTAAVDALKRGLEQVAPEDPLYWRLQVELLASYRSLGQFDEAQQLIEWIAQGDPPPSIQLQSRAEAIRLLLDLKRPNDALGLVKQGRAVQRQTSPELDYAGLQTYLALWQQANAADEQPQAESWRQQAVTMVEFIEQTYGVYWGRRSDLLLVKTAGGSQAGGDVELLARTADNLYRNQQYDDAVTTYQQAGEAAMNAGDQAAAFAQFYKAALVEHTRQRHVPAAELLRAFSVRLKSQPQAADSHLLAAWNAAQAARSDAAMLDQYQTILEEHVQTWPQAASTVKARIWLGRLLEGREAWDGAVVAYAGVPRDSELFSEAVEALDDCYQQRIARTKRQGEAVEPVARTAAEWFQQQITDPPPAQWTSTDRRCAESAASLLMHYVPGGHAQAEQVLRAALAGTPPPEAAWKNNATSLLVLALAGQPDRRAEAEQTLLSIGGDSPERLMEVFVGLAKLVAAADAETQRGLAELQLAVVDRLGTQATQLDANRQQFLRRAQAEALLLAGRRGEAVKAYADLAEQLPNDGELQAAYGQLLLDGPDRDSWQQALDQWRRVASHTRPQTDAWYRARYATSQALVKLGDKQQAAARIRYLQTVPPGLDNTPWREPFAELLKQCE